MFSSNPANLGSQYLFTGDAHHSFSRVAHFYELAAELDQTGVQLNPGLMYERGLGVIVDRNRAAGWTMLAERAQLENLLIDLKQAWVVSNEQPD